MFNRFMQLLYSASCAQPTTLFGRERKRIANKLREILSVHFDPIVHAQIGGFPLLVHASNWNPVNYASGKYDDFPIPRLVRFIAAERGEALGCIDIGANVGFTALMACAAAPKGRFLLIEGDPYSFELLDQNTRSIANRTLVHTVLGDADGTIDGEFMHESGTASFVPYGTRAKTEHAVAFSAKRVEHRVSRLDTLAADMARVDYVKIDTDGAETKILAGAQETLSRHKPVVFSEFGPQGIIAKGFDRNPERLFDLFSSAGFEFYCFYTQRGRLVIATDQRKDRRIMVDLMHYCISAPMVMDIAVFHADHERQFASFVAAERAYVMHAAKSEMERVGWQ